MAARRGSGRFRPRAAWILEDARDRGDSPFLLRAATFGPLPSGRTPRPAGWPDRVGEWPDSPLPSADSSELSEASSMPTPTPLKRAFRRAEAGAAAAAEDSPGHGGEGAGPGDSSSSSSVWREEDLSEEERAPRSEGFQNLLLDLAEPSDYSDFGESPEDRYASESDSQRGEQSSSDAVNNSLPLRDTNIGQNNSTAAQGTEAMANSNSELPRGEYGDLQSDSQATNAGARERDAVTDHSLAVESSNAAPAFDKTQLIPESSGGYITYDKAEKALDRAHRMYDKGDGDDYTLLRDGRLIPTSLYFFPEQLPALKNYKPNSKIARLQEGFNETAQENPQENPQRIVQQSSNVLSESNNNNNDNNNPRVKDAHLFSPVGQAAHSQARGGAVQNQAQHQRGQESIRGGIASPGFARAQRTFRPPAPNRLARPTTPGHRPTAAPSNIHLGGHTRPAWTGHSQAAKSPVSPTHTIGVMMPGDQSVYKGVGHPAAPSPFGPKLQALSTLPSVFNDNSLDRSYDRSFDRPFNGNSSSSVPQGFRPQWAGFQGSHPVNQYRHQGRDSSNISPKTTDVFNGPASQQHGNRPFFPGHGAWDGQMANEPDRAKFQNHPHFLAHDQALAHAHAVERSKAQQLAQAVEQDRAMQHAQAMERNRALERAARALQTTPRRHSHAIEIKNPRTGMPVTPGFAPEEYKHGSVFESGKVLPYRPKTANRNDDGGMMGGVENKEPEAATAQSRHSARDGHPTNVATTIRNIDGQIVEYKQKKEVVTTQPRQSVAEGSYSIDRLYRAARPVAPTHGTHNHPVTGNHGVHNRGAHNHGAHHQPVVNIPRVPYKKHSDGGWYPILPTATAPAPAPNPAGREPSNSSEQRPSQRPSQSQAHAERSSSPASFHYSDEDLEAEVNPYDEVLDSGRTLREVRMMVDIECMRLHALEQQRNRERERNAAAAVGAVTANNGDDSDHADLYDASDAGDDDDENVQEHGDDNNEGGAKLPLEFLQ